MALSPGWRWLAALLLAAAPPARAADPGWPEFEAKLDDDAVALWSARAKLGDPMSQLGLGIAYDLGRGVPANAQTACDWYGRAAAAGLPAAEFNAGVMQDAGRCGPRNAQAAATWYARAAARGHARAAFNMGQLYAAGDGVPRSAAEARAWMTAAASDGIAAATVKQIRLPASSAASSLAPATPAWPAGIVSMTEVPLVWTSPEQPAGTGYVVELATLGTDDHAIRSMAAPRTALLVSLTPGAYAWRVLTADPTSHHYAASPWSAFEVAPMSAGNTVGTANAATR